VTLLERYGRYEEAAAIHFEEGRPIDAILLFMRDTTNVSSRERAATGLIQAFWRDISFGVSIASERSLDRAHLDQMLAISKQLTSSSTSIRPGQLDEVSNETQTSQKMRSELTYL
jgi:hypothetical protein